MCLHNFDICEPHPRSATGQPCLLETLTHNTKIMWIVLLIDVGMLSGKGSVPQAVDHSVVKGQCLMQ